MTVLFLLYAGIIPAVPLIGAEIYKRRNDNTRRSVCYVLFFSPVDAQRMLRC